MELPIIERNGQRLLTTKQIAEAYKADVKAIQYNFRYNKEKYQEGKHYFELTGDDLRALKTRREFHSSLKYAKRIYLWTERGALLHAKSVNTDEAWQVYDWLVDFYFRKKEEKTIQPAQQEQYIDIAANREFQDKLKELDEYCITIRCLIREFGAQLPPSKIAGMSYAIYHTGAMIITEAHGMEKIALGEKEKTWKRL